MRSLRHRFPAFTLVELLVVIAIIVILLAMLVPSLEKALRQTELAICGTNLKTIGGGAATYAVDQKRFYPHRKALSADAQPNYLNDPWTGGATPENTDDRLVLKDYIPLDALVDPLCDPISLDPSDTSPKAKNAAQNTPEPFVFAGYYMFFGWQYTDTPSKGMLKMGDRFSWTSTDTRKNLFGKSGSWTFNVMGGDQNAMPRTLEGYASSHPDSAGLLPLQTLYNEPVTRGTGGLGLDEGFYYVLSRYIISGTSNRRGTLDLNYLGTDGGVFRLNDVAWDEEDRVTSAPIGKGGPGQFDYWIVLPKN